MKTTLSRRTYTKTSYVDDTISVDNDRNPQPFEIAVSDESTDLAADAVNPAIEFPMDTNRRISEIFAEVNVAPVGATIVIDVHAAGTTIFSTTLTIDAGEVDSDTAATPAVISTYDIPEKTKVEVFVTQVGSTTAGAGLKLIFK
jgi:hypothetical protein